MDSIETPYDVDADFIVCTVCDKSIRGETLYKIHLTTPGHLKKEGASVTQGEAVKRTLPDFKDILHYLDYLQLDEPIIGLNFVQDVPSDETGTLKYLCGLCHLTANLSEMVHHLIGRKHRQKYVELKRPDLVTWEKNISINQAGKIIRAKAEIIERQDGRGVPILLTRRENESQLNKSKAPAKQRKTWEQTPAYSQPRAQTHSWRHREHGNEFSHAGRYKPEFSDEQPYPPEEPYSRRERSMRRPMGHPRDDHPNEEQYMAEYGENVNRREYMEPYNDKSYGGDMYGRTYEPDGDQYYPEEKPVPHGQTRHVEYYQEESASYSRPLPERDPLKKFFFDEVQLHKESDNHHSKVDRHWPPDKNYSKHSSTSTAALREPEATRSFSAQRESETTTLFNIIKDYQQTMRAPSEEPSTMGRNMDLTKSMSGIPEPFRRFLTGASSDEQPGKRKRKSRFSDATAEEVSMVRGYEPEYEPPHSKYSSSSRPESHNDFYTGSQRSQYSEQFRGEDSEPVFNILKSVEIENAEEADFLKNKLCSLLKEFRTRKSDRTMERPLLEDLDLRRSQNQSMRDDHISHTGGPDWRRQEDCPPEERIQENAARSEKSYRSRYEEVFGVSGASHPLGSSYLDEPSHYSGRFEEPMHSRGYRHASREYFDSHSPPPPQNLEGSHYSRNLDKITSTLLELVSRK